jgi:ATP-dependent Clp protease adaptor protein ClpS
MGTQVEIKEQTKTDITVQEPPMFRVIYVNDEKTTVEFVVESLIEHFDYDAKGAEHITLDIHNNGSATVAVLPYEIAEQKGVEVTVSARSNGYPLMVKIEPESV